MQGLFRKNRIWIALVLAALLLAGCGETKPAPTPEPTETPAPTAAPTPTPTPAPTPEPTPEAPASATDLPGTPASNSDIAVTPTPTPEATPEPTPMPTPPPPQPVDDSFFADAAFLGNSLMEGLHLFGGLKYGDFYSGTSASVVSVGATKDFKDRYGAPCTRLHALLEKQYHRIFVLFGINELGFQPDAFISIYTELLQEIAAGEPDAEIYILSLTPITEKKAENSDLFTKERVLEFNAAIAAMAQQNGWTYMDLYGAMSDENGWLPEKDASDGIHFTGPKYVAMADYLRCYPYVMEFVESAG